MDFGVHISPRESTSNGRIPAGRSRSIAPDRTGGAVISKDANPCSYAYFLLVVVGVLLQPLHLLNVELVSKPIDTFALLGSSCLSDLDYAICIKHAKL